MLFEERYAHTETVASPTKPRNSISAKRIKKSIQSTVRMTPDTSFFANIESEKRSVSAGSEKIVKKSIAPSVNV